MRKTFFVLALGMCSAVLFAQEDFTVSGEVKSGILSTLQEDGIAQYRQETRMGSRDDAGEGAGRFRLNMEYRKNNLGFKFRVNWEIWNEGPGFPYGFGYGDFFNDQLTVSLGKLGLSPWGTGERDLWYELEAINDGGVRFEYKPGFVPGLNVGLVLNGFNGTTPQTSTTALTENTGLLDILSETVVGASYTHDLFHVRIAYRFDSGFDYGVTNAARNDGGQLVYRVEERALKNILSGLQVWAVGYINGIGAETANESSFEMYNRLFAAYEHEYFDAGLRVGFDKARPPLRGNFASEALKTVQYLHVTPHFYWKYFGDLGNLFTVGANFEYALDLSETKVYEDSYFYYWQVEPSVQVNFTSNTYAAFSYTLRRQYVHDDERKFNAALLAPIHQTQWYNLRFGIIF
jgi:hypothetical protein